MEEFENVQVEAPVAFQVMPEYPPGTIVEGFAVKVILIAPVPVPVPVPAPVPVPEVLPIVHKGAFISAFSIFASSAQPTKTEPVDVVKCTCHHHPPLETGPPTTVPRTPAE